MTHFSLAKGGGGGAGGWVVKSFASAYLISPNTAGHSLCHRGTQLWGHQVYTHNCLPPSLSFLLSLLCGFVLVFQSPLNAREPHCSVLDPCPPLSPLDDLITNMADSQILTSSHSCSRVKHPNVYLTCPLNMTSNISIFTCPQMELWPPNPGAAPPHLSPSH